MEGKRGSGLTLRWAALIAGLLYLFNPAAYAEFGLYPKIVVAGNPAKTLHNITADPHSFILMIACWFIEFLEDVVAAWALYYLFRPTSKAGSLLAAIVRLLYAAIVLSSVGDLLFAYRIATTELYATTLGAGGVATYVYLAIQDFRVEEGYALIIFGAYLIVIGYLILRSSYVPKILAPILAIDGLGWITNGAQPYLFPTAHLDWVFYTAFGEIVFMLWLLIGGWFIREQV